MAFDVISNIRTLIWISITCINAPSGSKCSLVHDNSSPEAEESPNRGTSTQYMGNENFDRKSVRLKVEKEENKQSRQLQTE